MYKGNAVWLSLWTSCCRFSTNKVKEVKEKVDQVNYGYLQEARARARYVCSHSRLGIQSLRITRGLCQGF